MYKKKIQIFFFSSLSLYEQNKLCVYLLSKALHSDNEKE